MDNLIHFADSPVSVRNASFEYNVVYLNRAPAVQQSLLSLTPILEDLASNEGLQVDNITHVVASDEDDPSLGLAVFSVDTNNSGAWEYRHPGYTAWVPFPEMLSRESALLLTPEMSVRFNPREHFNGNVSFSALAWDQSSSSNDTTASNNFIGAFSVDSFTVFINVTRVNDPPTVTLTTTSVTYQENGPPVQIFAGVKVMDVDMSDGISWATVTLRCPNCSVYPSVEGTGGPYDGEGDVLTPPDSSDVILSLNATVSLNLTVSVGYAGSDIIVLNLSIPLGCKEISHSYFQQYLRSLHFTNRDTEPSPASREVDLVVSDGDDESQVVTVEVSISTVNDQVPMVTVLNSTTIFVEESPPISLFLGNVDVSDLDSLIFHRAEVKLSVQASPDELLMIDPSVGNGSFLITQDGVTISISGLGTADQYEELLDEIMYNNSIDEPGDVQRTVSVRIYDGDFWSEPAVITITVRSFPDNKPEFIIPPGDLTVALCENTPVGYTLLTVVAIDKDVGTGSDIDQYEIFTEFFSINDSTGVITVEREIDFEENEEITFIVTALNSALESGDVSITVRILNNNDFAPVFSPLLDQPLYIPEDFPVGSPIPAPTSASDGDSCGIDQCNGTVPVDNSTCTDPVELSYAIISGNEEGFFEIDGRTGMIFLNKSLPSTDDQVTSFNLMLSVNDGQLWSQAQLVIIVDTCPMFGNDSYSVSVNETVPIGTTVITVVATDVNPASIISYSLAGINNEHFSIDPSTGVVSTAVPLDYETVMSYSLMALASDNIATCMAMLNVTVLPLNDEKPVFDMDNYTFHVLENQPPSSSIGRVEASDPDSDNITYSITLSSSSGNFSVDPTTGDLMSLASFDREEQAVHYIWVVATDDGGLYCSVLVYITILDENDNSPVFVDSETFPQREDLPPPVVVANVAAMDADAGNNSLLTYSIVNGGDIFEVNPSTGVVQSIVSLDYEQASVYDLTVMVTDHGIPPLSASLDLSVSVIDVDDNPPAFEHDSIPVTLLENVTVGTFVAEVTATDADAGANTSAIQYELLSTFDLFQIDDTTGEITVSYPLSDENVHDCNFSISLRVRAFNPRTDSGLEDFSDVIVSIVDINEAPSFSQNVFTANISESNYFGSGSGLSGGEESVVILTATDGDCANLPNGQLHYFITGGDDLSVFMLDEYTGHIVLIGELDREEREFYELSVVVRDSGTPALTDSATVQIRVLDEDDSPPVFQNTPLEASIPEDSPPDTFVTQVLATDADAGTNAIITYAILETSSPFSINAETGSVLVTGALDREAVPSYVVTIVAEDMGVHRLTSMASLTISVSDVNDNAPVITPDILSLTIPENVPIGTAIANFTITDADVGVNSEYSVEIVGDSKFLFNVSSSELVVSGMLDYETIESHNFTVVVRDHGDPLMFASALVSVDLQNVNDNPPVKSVGVNSINYLEGHQTLALDIGITISDADGRDFAPLSSGVVAFTDYNSFNPSFPFTPNSDHPRVPFQCPLQDTHLKFEACGFSSDLTVPTQDEAEFLNTFNFDESNPVINNTIVFNSSKEQYAVYLTGLPTIDQEGGTVASWVWLESMETSVPQTLFTKATVDRTFYGVVCHPNHSLQFNYYSEGVEKSIWFEEICMSLKGEWHHLAVVLWKNTTSHWFVSLFIDGDHAGKERVTMLSDGVGWLFLGARPPPGIPFTSLGQVSVQDYLHGRLHFLAVSSTAATETIVRCAIGCGMALRSPRQTPLLYHYNYTSRSLIISGEQPTDEYEQFLDSLIWVQPFMELCTSNSNFSLACTLRDTDGLESSPTHLFITIISFNTYPPEISLNGEASVSYSTVFVEEAGPVPVVNQSSFFLTDADCLTFDYTVDVEILDPLQPATEEVLDVSCPSSLTCLYEDYVLKIEGPMGILTFESALRTVMYNNLADEPTGTTRTLRFYVSDPPGFSSTAFATVSIQYVNDFPELQAVCAYAMFREGGEPVRVFENLTISDSDNEVLVSARVDLTAPDGSMELLSVNTSGTNISSSYDASTNALMLTGEDTLAAYSSVLSSLTYSNLVEGDPSPGARNIYVTAFDGLDESLPLHCEIFLEAVNNPPVLDLNGPSSPGSEYVVIFREDRDTEVQVVSPDAVLMDVDNESLVLDVEYIGILDEDTIEPAITTGLLPVNEIITALKSIRYRNINEEVTPGNLTIRFTVSDGQNSVEAYSTIIVEPANDRVFIDLDSTVPGTGYNTSFTESGPPVYVTSRNVTIQDNDVDASISSLTIDITNALDALSEMIESAYFDLPSPNLLGPTTVSYTIVPANGSLPAVQSLLASLTYGNFRTEPTRGVRLIEISASDGFEPSNKAFSIIDVVSVNNNPPMFTQDTYSASLPENFVSNNITTVLAEDSDRGIDGVVRYEIISSTPYMAEGYFSIDAVDGTISNQKDIDREMIDHVTLNVSAFDAGTPSRTAYATVEVDILDDNDNAPEPFPFTRFFSVPESSSVGTVIGMLQFTDRDQGSNAEISLELSPDNTPFAIEDDGSIIVISELDADKVNPVYVITVVATDMGQPPMSSEETITIVVNDTNDNAPEFSSDVYSISVLENTPAGGLFNVSATDRDSGANGEISFSFMDPMTQDVFSIGADTGLISSVVSLDREQRENYMFVVVATDGGAVPLSSSALVNVTVLDANDNVPTFEEQVYNISVQEEVGMLDIVTVQATDEDAGLNGAVRYSLMNNRSALPFSNQQLSINAENGTITLLEPVDHEIQQSFTFTVVARDLGQPSLNGSAMVRVTVLDINDHHPVFTEDIYEAMVSETQAAGHTVVTVMATDLDSGSNGEVEYSLLNHQDVFQVDAETGAVTTKTQLDFEKQCFYQVNVVARDNGTPSPSSFAVIYVAVLAEHDIAPVFTESEYNTALLENATIGTVVDQVMATDGDQSVCIESLGSGGSGESGLTPDSELNLEYSIISGNEAIDGIESFEIDTYTGVITTLTELDRETVPLYSLTVEARDQGGLTASSVVMVTVMDVNDNSPSFSQANYSDNVTENEAIGRSILQLSAMDPDTVDDGMLTFSLLGNPFFFLVNQSGFIIVSGSIDREEVGGMISFTAVVTDTAGNSGTAMVTIRITDQNDNPPNITSPVEEVDFIEGQVSIAPFSKASISEVDENMHICNATIELLSSQYMDSSSFEGSCSCTNSSDAASCTPGCLEFLQLPPAFSSPLSLLGQGELLQLDGYFPVADYQAAIQAVEYINVVSKPLPSNASIILTVSDCVSESSLIIDVNIIPLNQNPPVLDLNGDSELGTGFATIFVERGPPIPIVSTNLTITDADSDCLELTSLDVWMSSSPHDGDQESIYLPDDQSLPSAINITQLTPHRLTLEGVASFPYYRMALVALMYSNAADEPNASDRIITFVAHQYHLSSSPAMTTITLDPINDQSPRILSNPPDENSFVTYAEGTTCFRLAPNAVIEDMDSFDTPIQEFVVDLIDDGSAQDHLFLSESFVLPSPLKLEQSSNVSFSVTGEASLLVYQDIIRNVCYQFRGAEFDDKSRQPFVTLRVVDTDGKIGFSGVFITLQPVNDQQPMFIPETYSAIVPEDASIGDFVLQVTAMDQDRFSDSQIQYSITSGADGLFVISSDTGIISVSSSLDFETNSLHAVFVQAVDLAIDSSFSNQPGGVALVNIMVGDINDHQPMFTQDMFTANVTEGSPVGTFVLKLSATDLDGDSHSVLEFELRGTSAFSVDEEGNIVTAEAIDREDTVTHTFAANVRNPGNSKFDSAFVQITVLDLDDNAPVITLDPSSAELLEPQTLVSLSAALRLSDLDPDPSLAYAVVQVLHPAPGTLLSLVANDLISVAGNETSKVTFQGQAALADYQAVLRGVAYQDLAPEPVPVNRTVAYQVGSETPVINIELISAPGETHSNISEFVITIVNINDNPPQILLDTRNETGTESFECPQSNTEGSFSTVFTEGSSPVAITDSSLSIVDLDVGMNNYIHSAVVEIVDPQNGMEEWLTVSLSSSITESPDSVPHRLVLQGPASASEYEAVLKTIT